MRDGGYPLPAVVSPANSVYVCVRIPDDMGHRQAFAGALYTLTRWWNWQKDSEKTAKDAGAEWFPIFLDVMQQLDRRLTSCGDGDGGDSCGECAACKSSGGGYGDGGDGAEKEDENMNIIYMPDGKAYLADNTCGCPTKFFALSGVELVVDGDGVSIPKLGPKDVPVDFAPVGADYQACYAGKAVPYLLARATEFHATLTEIYTTGVDFLVGGIDEWLDIGAIIADLLGGDTSSVLDTLRGYSEEDVEDAFTDPDFVDIMEANFVSDGPVDRIALMTWAKSAPVTWNNVGTMAILRNWVSMSFVQGYGEALRTFAAECVTGNDAADLIGGGVLQPDGSLYREIDVAGTIYPTWEYVENHIVDSTTYNADLTSPTASTIGFFTKGIVAAGTGTIDVAACFAGIGANRKSGMVAESTQCFGIASTANAALAAEAILGSVDSWASDYGTPAPVSARILMVYWTAATPRQYTSNRHVFVGAAL